MWGLVLTLAILGTTALAAQYQRQPPDFGGTYEFPTPTHPEPPSHWLTGLDVLLLTFALGLAAWLILKRRNRNGVLLLSMGAVGYFGFFREGCVCPIGAIQNVTLTLVDPYYDISFGVIAFFFLPLFATLLFGRVFCGGVCPLGAIQDLVLLRPQPISPGLDRVLGWLRYVYLGVAVLFAGWGLNLAVGGFVFESGRRFLICEWDPFIGLFRLTGSFHMLAIGGGFILAGMFIGRPYCRWFCPYGGILAILSRVAWKNVQITPDRELDCGLCANSCPFGAIADLRADRASCLACARCYASCPRELERRGVIDDAEEFVRVHTQ
jgi:ferredoxin